MSLPNRIRVRQQETDQPGVELHTTSIIIFLPQKRTGGCEEATLMRRVVPVAMLLVLTVVLTACGGAPSSADTGSGSSQSQPASSGGGEQKAANEARHPVNKEYEVNGLKIKIGEVVVQKDRVIVGMTVSNPGNNTKTFYPDHGNAVVGTMQLDANMFFTEGDVSGEISGGVVKEGVIHFLVPKGKSLDPATVTQIKLNLGKVFDDTNFSVKEFSETITLGG